MVQVEGLFDLWVFDIFPLSSETEVIDEVDYLGGCVGVVRLLARACRRLGLGLENDRVDGRIGSGKFFRRVK